MHTGVNLTTRNKETKAQLPLLRSWRKKQGFGNTSRLLRMPCIQWQLRGKETTEDIPQVQPPWTHPVPYPM